jgi:hypothetical protein
MIAAPFFGIFMMPLLSIAAEQSWLGAKFKRKGKGAD